MNTVPRSLTGEPLTEDELAQLASKNSDMSYPEDERVEEKKTEDDVPNYTSTRVTNLEVSLEGEEADYVAVIGDIVVTAYGEGKVVSSSTETESVEVELPYGRLFVRLTETLVKKGVKAAVRRPRRRNAIVASGSLPTERTLPTFSNQTFSRHTTPPRRRRSF